MSVIVYGEEDDKMDGGQKTREDPRRLAELSALADGTLDPARREEVQARIDASEDLRGRLEAERRAVALLSAVREHDRAPAALRERIETARSDGRATAGGRARPSRGATPGRRTTSARWGPWGRRSSGFRVPTSRLAGASALVVLVVILALILPAGAPSTPSIAQAAALGALGPTQPAPVPQLTDPAKLRPKVGTLHFPNWSRTIGWRAIGQRRDILDGRRVPTVYYAKAGATVAYAIVSGDALPWSAGAKRQSGKYPYQSFDLHGRNVVTWREDGHTCLLSAARVPARVLASLIAYT